MRGVQEVKGKFEVPMSKQRGLDQVPVFEGKHEQFDGFRTKFSAFISDMEGVMEFWEWAEKQEECDLTMADIEDYGRRQSNYVHFDARKCSRQLRATLILKTTGDAHTMVENTGMDEGVLAWHRLVREYGRITPQARRRLLKAVVWPTQAKTYEDVHTQKEKWEKCLRKYREASPQPLPEDVLILGFQQLLPTKLLDAVFDLDREFDTVGGG